MGLMTFLTGKTRRYRQLESRDKKLDDRFIPMLLEARKELKIQDGNDFTLWLASWKIGVTLNEYVTHWVRTTIDLHPRWTTEGNFNDEGPILVDFCLAQVFSIQQSNDSDSVMLEVAKRAFVVTSCQPDAPSCDELLRDMFKNCPVEMLIRVSRFEKEALRALKLFRNDCENAAVKSELPHDIEFTNQLVTLFSYQF